MRATLATSALFSLVLWSCTTRTTVIAPTQVMLRVYSSDSALLEQMSTLSVSFALRENDEWRTYPERRFDKALLAWPIDIPIIPGKREDSFKQFEVVVRALAGDQVLAETRAISSFVPDERRVLEVWLFSCPAADKVVCALPDCHGELCAVCRGDGSCAPVGATDPQRLPQLIGGETPLPKDPPPVTPPIVTNDKDGSVVMPGIEAGPKPGMDATVPGMDADVVTVPVPVVDCTTFVCDGNARCIMNSDGPACECLPGYADVEGTCEDIDECMADDGGGCSVNARCDNTVGGRTCTCKRGFVDVSGDGTECVDACLSAGCHDNASCSIVEGEPQCTCLPAYIGDGKDECVFDSACEQLNCHTNATCEVSGTNRICQCKPGYEGDGTSCTNPDACTPNNPCMNGGTCHDGLGDFSCDCRNGFEGDSCETNIDDCRPTNPCMNGGRCTDLIADFSCNCADTGFSGDQCQTNINDCPNGACMPGGLCADGVKNYSCNCGAGYDGTGTKSCTNHNDCPSGACMPGGTCVDGQQSYSCNCTVPGYVAMGTACVDVNNCLPDPCKNGGRCGDLPNDFTCDCTNTGFIGKICDMRTAGCSSAGEQCTVGVGECLNRGVYVCDPGGNTVSCSVSPLPPTTEKCDGKDNNCVDGIDELPAPLCVGQSLRHCVSGSTIDTPCAASSDTCFNNACGGDCAVGRNRCSGGNSQQCNGVGMWAPHPTHATCTSSPPERCDNDQTSSFYGTCVDNTPFPVGSNASSGTGYNITNNRLIAQPIIAPDNVRLTHFGLRTTNNAFGSDPTSTYLSLHEDNTSSPGQPGALRNRTAQFNLMRDSSNIQSPVSSAAADVALTKNKLYWIVGNFALSGTATPSIFINPSSAAGPCRVGTRAFAAPADLPVGSTSMSNGEFTLFIQVQR